MGTVIMALGYRSDLPARHPGLLAARQALRADRRRQRGLARAHALPARCAVGQVAGTATVVGTTASRARQPRRRMGARGRRRLPAPALRGPRRPDDRAAPARRSSGAACSTRSRLRVGDRLPLVGRGRAAGPAHRRALRRARQRRAHGDLRPPLGPTAALGASDPCSTSCSCTAAPTRTRCRARSCGHSARQFDVEVTEDGVRQERSDLRPVVYGTDAVLLAIGLVNLLTTLLLGIRERVRDFAIFKVVGLTPRQVLAAVTSGGTLLSSVAVVAGDRHRAAGLPRARDGDQPVRRARSRHRPDVVVGRAPVPRHAGLHDAGEPAARRAGRRRSSRPRRCVTNEPVRGP